MADKLISLETLRKEVERNFDMQDLYLPVHFFDVAENVAEAVVRCKDCKHRPINIDGNSVHGYILRFPDYKCPAQCSDGYYDWFPEDDWFCANGEKKEDTE